MIRTRISGTERNVQVMVGSNGGEGGVPTATLILVDRNKIVANRLEDTIRNFETRYNFQTFRRICEKCRLYSVRVDSKSV